MSSVSRIHDHVREGRLTPEQGAWLMALRRELTFRRLPWWKRTFITLFGERP